MRTVYIGTGGNFGTVHLTCDFFAQGHDGGHELSHESDTNKARKFRYVGFPTLNKQETCVWADYSLCILHDL